MECACKNDLGQAHLQCASSWFDDRPNRQGSISHLKFASIFCDIQLNLLICFLGCRRKCEICGETPKHATLLHILRTGHGGIAYANRVENIVIPKRTLSDYIRPALVDCIDFIHDHVYGLLGGLIVIIVVVSFVLAAMNVPFFRWLN